MSGKKINPAIGTCPCPISGCKETCEVRKFQHRATLDTQRRRAGKFYLWCPTHESIGSSGAKALQEWILENGKIDGAEPAPRPTPAPAAKPKQAAPVRRAAPPPPKPASTPAPEPEGSGWFRTLLG